MTPGRLALTRLRNILNELLATASDDLLERTAVEIEAICNHLEAKRLREMAANGSHLIN
jgi:hypothetical protein